MTSLQRIKICFPGSTRRHFDRVTQLLGTCVERKLLLDVGTGTGGLPDFLSRRLHCNALGVDIVSGIRTNHTPFVVADSSYLPFRSSSFDIVMSHEFFSHSHDFLRSLSEQRRVLKEEGLFIVSDGNLLSPVTLFDLIVLYPLRSRGKRGGLRWLFRKRKEIKNYLKGTPQKDEDIKTRFWWTQLLERYGFTGIRFPFRISYVAKLYISARKPNPFAKLLYHPSETACKNHDDNLHKN